MLNNYWWNLNISPIDNVSLNKNKSLKKLSYTSIFLALCIVLVTFQIPVYAFLNIDFSLVPLLISIRFIGYRNAYLIAVLYPWFAFLSYMPTDIIGVLILITFNLFVLTTKLLFEKIKLNHFVNLFFEIVIVTFLMVSVNILFFTPWYVNFDYEQIFQDVWYLFGIYSIFNLIKLSSNYVLIEIVNYKLKINNFSN